MPLIPDPRSKLARNFKEGLDLTDIMPGGMGMAAKMSSPAVDVLSRWIRRFRKDKPPTVPLKNIEKALKHEYKRRTQLGLGNVSDSFDRGNQRMWHHPIEQRSYMGPENLPVPVPSLQRGDLAYNYVPNIHRPLGAQEKDPFEELWDFVQGLRKGHPPNAWPMYRTPSDVHAEELARNWKKK